MSDTFKASNGVRVTRRGESVRLSCEFMANRIATFDDLNMQDMDALREFFLHERDKELGRWRDPEDPNMYVITDEDGRLNVVNESTSRWTPITRELIAGYPDVMPERKTGARYFATHPEPRPWHDAKPGEVWAITTENVADEVAVQRTDTGDWQYCDGLAFRDNELKIETARRIWPEVTP